MDIIHRLQGLEFEWDENKARSNIEKQGRLMNKPEEEFELRFRPRAAELVSLEIPKDALDSLKKIAAIRDMSYKALLKFYIGKGVRQDLSKLFADRVLDAATEVLTRHLQSEEEVSAIIREIREARTLSGEQHEIAA